jgi:hypothetical protein
MYQDEPLSDDILEGLKKAKGGSGKSKPNGAAVPTEIFVVSGKRHEAADQGLSAIHKAGVSFYQRDRVLVRVCLIKAKNSDAGVRSWV